MDPARPCIAWVLALGACAAPRASAPRPEIQEPDSHSSGLGTGCVEAGPLLVWAEPGFVQEYDLSFRPRSGAHLDPNAGTWIEVHDSLLDPRSGAWSTHTHVERASFGVTCVATARRDRFALAGWDETNGTILVLQTWDVVDAPDGTRGSPDGVVPGQASGKVIQRHEIYHGLLGAGLRSIEYDAEERFIYLLVEDGAGIVSLYRFINEPGADPILIANSNEIPELLEASGLSKYDHPGMGRQLVCWAPPWDADRHVVFVDADNDGAFDGEPIAGTYAHLEATGVVGIEVSRSMRGPGL